MTTWEIVLEQLRRCGAPTYHKVCPPHQAEALQLRDQGYDVPALARHFGISYAAAQMLIDRAQRRLAVIGRIKDGIDPRAVADEMNISYQGVVQIIKQARENGHA